MNAKQLPEQDNSEKQKIKSETPAFDNVGKFRSHIMKVSKKLKLNVYEIGVYMLLVDYSFGYTNNIQYKLKISTRQISDELSMSVGKASMTLISLIKYGLIKREKGQDVGPKQIYKYSVVFPEGYHIKHKSELSNEDKIEKANADLDNML